MDERLSSLHGANKGQGQGLLRELSQVTRPPMVCKKHWVALFPLYQVECSPSIRNTALAPTWLHAVHSPTTYLISCVTLSRLYPSSVPLFSYLCCAEDLNFIKGKGSKVSWKPCIVKNTLEKCLKSPKIQFMWFCVSMILHRIFQAH